MSTTKTEAKKPAAKAATKAPAKRQRSARKGSYRRIRRPKDWLYRITWEQYADLALTQLNRALADMDPGGTGPLGRADRIAEEAAAQADAMLEEWKKRWDPAKKGAKG